MKKLLFALVLCSGFSLSAQTRQTLSVAVGPGWFQQFSGGIADGPSYHPQSGWGGGLDYGFGIAANWDLKVAVRYHQSRMIEKSGGEFAWPSEYATGMYIFDPTLPHSFTAEHQIKAWQYLLGTRWYFGPPRAWRWYADAESGLTHYKQDQDRSGSSLYLTGGLGVGLQWLPPKKRFGVFFQPVLRYMTTSNRQSGYAFAFAIPAIELGLRTPLFTDN